jgi:hypothetical protein
MAVGYVNPGLVLVNAVDLTDHAFSCNIEFAKDELDATVFQSPFKVTIAGLPDCSITIGFYQDFAAAKVDATLYPLVTGTSSFAVSIKAAAGAISSTNPEFQLPAAQAFNYNPLQGSIGEMSTTEPVFKNAGTTGLVRDVTP